MKTFLIIGAGTFGHHLCREFSKQNCEFMVVDRDEKKVEDLLSIATSVRIADCSKQETLESFDIPSFDACFVCLGSDFQYSLEITSLLKDLGAKKIFSKADEDIQAKFLLRNGADEVLYPERDLAERIAVSESDDAIFDCIPMTKDYGIYEIRTRKDWIGKTVIDLDFRNAYNVSILATKHGDELRPLPKGDYVFNSEDHLVVLGKNTDIPDLIRKRINK